MAEYETGQVYTATVKFRDLDGHYFPERHRADYEGRRYRVRCAGRADAKYLPRHDDEYMFRFDPPKRVWPSIGWILSGDLIDIRYLPVEMDPLNGEKATAFR